MIVNPNHNIIQTRKPSMGLNWRACLVVMTASMVLLCTSVTFAREPQAKLSTIPLEIGGIGIEVEVASTPQQRSRGLSYRKHLGANAGMLFVYQKTQQLVFTMRETSIPLSIAFISEDLVINDIQKMQPWNREHYPARLPARYALEVNQGWFERHGIKVGDRLKMAIQ